MCGGFGTADEHALAAMTIAIPSAQRQARVRTLVFNAIPCLLCPPRHLTECTRIDALSTMRRACSIAA